MSQLGSSYAEYARNGYITLGWESCQPARQLRSELSSIIGQYFSCKDSWEDLDTKSFHSYCLACQRDIQEISFQSRFLSLHKECISRVTGIQTFFHESIVFLRAVRPTLDLSHDESLGFHRETMYSDSKLQTSKAHNIWIPLTATLECNSVKYYEGSHRIPDEHLEVVEDLSSARVPKGSDGHRLGNLYMPKKIVSSIYGYPVKSMLPNDHEFSLFSAMTIHGGGKNTGKDLRLSLSMAVIDKADIDLNKAYTAAEGNYHYIAL